MTALEEVASELRSLRVELRQMRERLTGGRAAFTLKEAAERLGVSPRTVARMVRRGELRTRTVGLRQLVPASEMDRLSAPPETKRAPERVTPLRVDGSSIAKAARAARLAKGR